jgi:hypothetical protein
MTCNEIWTPLIIVKSVRCKLQQRLCPSHALPLLFRAGYISGSVKTYGSNYEAMKRRQISNKRHLYNKSLDHVFKSRYQALTQHKNQQQPSQKQQRVKLTDVFQQQQAVLPRARRTSSALTVRDSVHGVHNHASSAAVKKHRRKSKDRHFEHL